MAEWRKLLVQMIEDDLRENKLTRSEFAAEIGVSHVTVGRWMKGEIEPGPRSWRKLARRWRIPETPISELRAGSTDAERKIVQTRISQMIATTPMSRLHRLEKMIELFLAEDAQEPPVSGTM